jgi:cystathionine gamma-synthase
LLTFGLMNAEEILLKQPVSRSDQLGERLPNSIHAVSVALPCWQDVVDYEEKSDRVSRRLTTGYPRFVVHPLVTELALNVTGGKKPSLPFPSERVAHSCAEFVRRRSGAPAEVVPGNGVHAVCTTEAGDRALRDFWQHTGLIVSSRQATALLSGKSPRSDSREILSSLRKQVAGFYDCGEDDVFLTATGMAAQYAALEAVKRRHPGQVTAQLGFPYVDTFKLQEKVGLGGILLHDLEHIERELTQLLQQQQELAACFCEIPGNPLLGSADLRRISPILRQQRVPLVADDVVATPHNIDLSGHADLVATSLTKFIAGSGDVMGGALICNPRSPLYGELKPLVADAHEELLWGEDAQILDRQARGFPERMDRHNRNGLFIAERLKQHPAVERVWYPKWEFSEAYEAVRRPKGGWGGLITFLPKNAEIAGPAIYDRLPVCKGPSLGTIFTLACPFTLLAHYTELPWAEACGVSRNLIRVSIGLEEPEELWDRFDKALAGI